MRSKAQPSAIHRGHQRAGQCQGSLLTRAPAEAVTPPEQSDPHTCLLPGLTSQASPLVSLHIPSLLVTQDGMSYLFIRDTDQTEQF